MITSNTAVVAHLNLRDCLLQLLNIPRDNDDICPFLCQLDSDLKAHTLGGTSEEDGLKSNQTRLDREPCEETHLAIDIEFVRTKEPHDEKRGNNEYQDGP